MKKTRLSDIFNADSIRNKKRILDRFEINKKEKRLFLDAVEEIEKDNNCNEEENNNDGSIVEKDFSFLDVDGNVLYTYTSEEALQLTELPDAPEIENMVFQKWYFDLKDIKDYKGFGVNIPLYTTGSNISRFYVELEEDNQYVYFGAPSKPIVRFFDKKGVYCVEINIARATIYYIDSNTIKIELGNTTDGANSSIDLSNCHKLKKIIYNKNYYITGNPFYNDKLKYVFSINKDQNPVCILPNVKYIVEYSYYVNFISNKLTKINSKSNLGGSISNLSNLKEFNYFGESHPYMGIKFYNLINLEKININTYIDEINDCPKLKGIIKVKNFAYDLDNITKIIFVNSTSSNIYDCKNLEYIEFDYDFKGNNKSIGARCPKVKYILFLNNTTIPTLQSSQFPTGTFVVPDNLYDEWIVATNWANVTDRIIKASEYEETQQ